MSPTDSQPSAVRRAFAPTYRYVEPGPLGGSMKISPISPTGTSWSVSGSRMRIVVLPRGRPTEPGCASHSRPVIEVPPIRSLGPNHSCITSGPSHSMNARISQAGTARFPS